MATRHSDGMRASCFSWFGPMFFFVIVVWEFLLLRLHCDISSWCFFFHLLLFWLQIGFFAGGWIFFVKQLFRNYEVRHISVQLIFSTTFALSLTMFELIIFEIVGLLESSSRYFHWRLELTLLLFMVIALIPFYIAYSSISNIRFGMIIILYQNLFYIQFIVFCHLFWMEIALARCWPFNLFILQYHRNGLCRWHWLCGSYFCMDFGVSVIRSHCWVFRTVYSLLNRLCPESVSLVWL